MARLRRFGRTLNARLSSCWGRIVARRRRRKCQCCGTLFRPDPRNVGRQRFCAAAACRRASKAASQAKWLAKPSNRDYFRDRSHVARVQAWRRAHPDYASRRPALKRAALQDSSLSQPLEANKETASLALQDPWLTQAPVVIGLVAQLSGLSLQDSIAEHLRHLEQLGRDIVNAGAHRG